MEGGERGKGRRDETEKERLDRNLIELLNELRVALPGVQVLFAFLLTVPFTNVFDRVTPFQERVYFFTLLATAAATLLMIAPSAHHRIEFRRKDKERIVFMANRLAIGGLAFLALAMSGVVLLITDVVFSRPAAIVATVCSGAAFALLWFALPVYRLLSVGRE
jgi:urea transporter